MKYILTVILFVSFYFGNSQVCLVQCNCSQTVSLPNVATIWGKTLSTNVLTGLQWQQLSGPTQSTILSPTASLTVVSNLSPGIYMYSLTAKFDNGSTQNALDTLYVTPMVDKVDSIKIFYRSGKIITQQ